MASEFFTILTTAGKSKIAAALAEQKQIRLQTMVVGDGNGKYVEPQESQTKVVHEVWRGQLNTLKIAPDNPAWVIAEAVLPEAVGGWYIREVGLLDADGTLIAIGKFPETYKPLLPAGASKQIVIRAVMEVTNAAAVTLMVDPSIVLATREYVDNSLKTHEKSRNHPDATLTQKGFTQLNSATNSTLETQAATPKAVKAAMDKANEALEKAGEDKSHKHAWGDITGVPDGTLTQKGVVKLNSATNSTSTTEAATPSAVKAAYDLAHGKAAGSHKHVWGDITGVPDGTLTQKGIVKLNNATDSTSTTEAATPSAVKAAMDKASAAAPANHTHTQFFTTNGTFTVPDGVTTIYVEVMGGGGGGAGGAESSHYEACGGHAGEQIISYLQVSPGQQFPIQIGAGGNGAPFWLNPPTKSTGTFVDETTVYKKGFEGGTSSFSNITATGGAGGENIYHSLKTQPYINFTHHPEPYSPGAGITYDQFYPGIKGESSLYGSGGKPGSIVTESLDNGGKKAVVISQTDATGYGAGGAGGSYSPSSRYVNGEPIDRFNTSGTKGSPGFVKITW